MEGVWTLLSFGPEGWGDNIAKGVLLTVTLALATLPLGLAIGFFVALGKRSNDKALRLAANIYTTIFRGLPEPQDAGMDRLHGPFHPLGTRHHARHLIRCRAGSCRAVRIGLAARPLRSRYPGSGP